MEFGNVVLTLVLACLASSGLASVIVAILQRKWSKEDKDKRIEEVIASQEEVIATQKAILNAEKVVMIDRVRWLSKQYILQGCISLEDKENLKEMYLAYKALGGNGHLDTAMAEIEKLPVGTEECA